MSDGSDDDDDRTNDDYGDEPSDADSNGASDNPDDEVDYSDEPDSEQDDSDDSSDNSDTEQEPPRRPARVIRSPVPPPRPRTVCQVYRAQCCVCLEDGLGVVMTATGVKLSFAGLRENAALIDSRLIDMRGLFIDNLVARGPCNEDGHDMCVRCLRRIMTNDDLLLVSLRQGRGFVPCQFTGFECVNSLRQRNVHALENVSYILPPAACRRFYVTCSDVRRACDAAGTDAADPYNHYVVPRVANDPLAVMGMLRHSDVTLDLVLHQFEELVKSETGDVTCKTCLTVLRRGSECNQLTHCGVSICCVCGKSDLFMGQDIQHWRTAEQPHRCPRYDDACTEFQHMGYACRGGTCYDVQHECMQANHAAGRQYVVRYKVLTQARKLWASLGEDLKILVKSAHVSDSLRIVLNGLGAYT